MFKIWTVIVENPNLCAGTSKLVFYKENTINFEFDVKKVMDNFSSLHHDRMIFIIVKENVNRYLRILAKVL